MYSQRHFSEVISCLNRLMKNSKLVWPNWRNKVRKRTGSLEFRVSEKGGVSVYGLGRFPVTLYYEQWTRLLDAAEKLREFLEENKSKLKLKGQ